MFKRFLSVVAIIIAIGAVASAQDIEVDRYNVTARIDLNARSIDTRAALAISNLSQTPKAKLYLRLTKLAKVSAVSVNGASATFETPEDRRVTTLNQLVITPPASLAAGGKATVEVSYRLEAPETSPLVSIYSGEVMVAPESMWIPMPTTPFTFYGPTTAPFTLTVTAPSGVNNFRAASAGAAKADAANQSFTFEQSLNSLPFFVAGSFEQPLAFDHGGVKVEIYTQPGLVGPDGAQNVINQLREETGRAIDFLTKTLGPPPANATFRIISSVRAGNLAVPGAAVFSQQIFRRDTAGAGAIEALADALARIWIDGRVRLRGQEQRSAQEDRPAQKARGTALLRDSLPRYLAALYIEDRYGKEAGSEAFSRMRWSYTPIAKSGRDAELGLQTLLVPTYGAAAFSKGPLVLRLMAETTGRDKFIAALQSALSGPQTKIITTDDFRIALVKSGGSEIEKIFQQWVESIVEPDIIIGVPLASDKPGAQRVNLRNLGTGDVTIKVLAVTASGKELTSSVTVPSEGITSTDIETTEKIVSVEADPEKLIIQTDYDNDAKPARTSAQTLFNDSLAAFNKGEYAQAETKLKEAARADADNALIRAWLARTLAAQKKNDEAATEANAALKIVPAVGAASAWAHITLGQLALARGDAAEAARNL
ncbi:MAG TPA: hypothetical protein VNO70_05985, partial [Blastocatellia bacterium]|nr:hypothetical protein [Blastocatellia bacterium]